MMLESGVGYGHVQPYFGTFVFELLLRNLHAILKCRHDKRVARKDILSEEMIKIESEEDYISFLQQLRWAIASECLVT